MRVSHEQRPESVRKQRHRLSRGYVALLATVAIWSAPSLFQYYLNRYYDPWSQNFYRYFVACIAIAPFVYYQMRRGAPKIDLHAISICLIPCLPNVIHQITQVVALFYMGPGVYAIFIRSSVIFTALLALIFFPGRTRRHSPMAISGWHRPRVDRRFWSDLVSSRGARSTYSFAGIGDCLHRLILLGALQHPGQTSLRPAGIRPQLWHH